MHGWGLATAVDGVIQGVSGRFLTRRTAARKAESLRSTLPDGERSLKIVVVRRSSSHGSDWGTTPAKAIAALRKAEAAQREAAPGRDRSTVPD